MLSTKYMSIGALSALAFVAPSAATPACAQEFYAGASGSLNFQSSSDNAGETGAFTTGNGAPALPFGTAIESGTDYGWDTDFETGFGAAIEAGFRYDNALRASIEVVWT